MKRGHAGENREGKREIGTHSLDAHMLIGQQTNRLREMLQFSVTCPRDNSR